VSEASAMTVGRFAAETLAASGIKVAFTVPGESFLGLLDQLPGAGIRVVPARHEAAAAFMASAYGSLTGRPALCLVTRAVGAANMAIGIHTARADSAPLIAIVGEVRTAVRGREAFQEADIAGSIGRLAKWATEVADAEGFPEAIRDALRHATSGRPGPVVVAVPEDVLDAPIGFSATVAAHRGMRPIQPDPATVRAVLHLLAGARSPVILAGAGVLRSNASTDLLKLAETLTVPVMAAWRRADVFPNDHRLYLGMTGLGAPSTVRDRLRDADALLVLGCRLSEIASFDYSVPARGTRWAHVDVEPRADAAGLDVPDIALAADAGAFLRVARDLLAGGVVEAAVVDARRAAAEADRTAFEEATGVESEPWDGPGVHPGRVIAALGRELGPETILTTDAGNFASWAARGYRFRRPGTFLGPTSGAMGYALPAAIAAAVARPGRQVVALAGDGGFAMTMAELETAVRERLPVTVLVFDNRRYGTIRAQQEERASGQGIATELGAIDFAAIAEACGAVGFHVARDGDFEEVLAGALKAKRPAVVHLELDRRWLSIDRRADEPGPAVAEQPQAAIAEQPRSDVVEQPEPVVDQPQAVVEQPQAVVEQPEPVEALAESDETPQADSARSETVPLEVPDAPERPWVPDEAPVPGEPEPAVPDVSPEPEEPGPTPPDEVPLPEEPQEAPVAEDREEAAPIASEG
jgi:acetolactate synthase-1/2/3 large subunit